MTATRTMTATRATRGEVEVDRINWIDTGCNLAPSCLNCPFPQCRYDTRDMIRLERSKSDATQACDLYVTGLNAAQVADVLGISKRSVFRLMARKRTDPRYA